MALSSPLASASVVPNAASHVENVARAPLTSNEPSAASTNRHGSNQKNKRQGNTAVLPSKVPNSNFANTSSNPTAPITVNPGPSNTAAISSTMKNKTCPLGPAPPDPTAFTFSSLLSSLGPEADDSITAIAEVCGTSKMSLADEHGSHMPPLGEAMVHIQREGGTAIESKVNARRVERESQAISSKERGLVGRVVEWLKGGRGTRDSSEAARNLNSVLVEDEILART